MRLPCLLGATVALLLAGRAGAMEAADVVYQNGRIHTVSPSRPWAEAVAVRDGRFLVVGTTAEMKPFVGAGTRVVDLEGKLVLPGLIDSHTHPSLEAQEPWHFETAFPWSLVRKHDRLSWVFRPSQARRVGALATSLKVMSSFGITAIGDGDVVPEVLPVWETLIREQGLRQHVVLFARALSAAGPSEMRGARQILESFRGHSLPGVKPGAKIFVDGHLEHHAAYLLEPYLDAGGARGAPNAPPAVIRSLVEELDAAGLPIQAHAIGDAAVRLVLDALEPVMRRRAGGSGPVHTLVHAKLVHPADVPRFAQLGVAVTVQPYWAQPGPANDFLVPMLGAARVEERYIPMRKLRGAGALVGSSSDWAATTMNPFYGMYVGATRESPRHAELGKLCAKEALTLEEMIRSYTIDNAALLGLQRDAGSIEPGKWADMVILDRNILERPLEELLETRVVRTIFQGDVVYDDSMTLPDAVERAERELLWLGKAH